MCCKLVVGNWKMNGISVDLVQIEVLIVVYMVLLVDVLICMFVILILCVVQIVVDSVLVIGGEDCYQNEKGVYIGDIFVVMLQDVGVIYVIIGYFECCVDYGEDDVLVCVKILVGIVVGLIGVVCIGEMLDEWEVGKILEVVGEQLFGLILDEVIGVNIVIVYELVWVIGIGKVLMLD